jgi:PST family polysaccharide transporter/antigen flippase
MMIAGSGYEQAGIWQATIKISSVYVGFFGLFLAYYFVPSVSPLVCNKNIKIIVWKYMSLIGTFFGASALVFYIGRDVFIEFLLSDEFLELSSLIHLQLIGDFFKILAFVVGFVFVAKAAVWIYITAEILQGFFLILFSSILYSLNPEIQSILKAYVLTNIIFFFSTLAVFYFYIKTSKFRGVS